MTLTSQQKSLVSQLGRIMDEELFNPKDTAPIVKAIQSFILQTISGLKNELIKQGKQTNSGALVQSVEPTDFEFIDSKFTMGIIMEDYWKYVDGGVNGLNRNVGAPEWKSLEGYRAGTFDEFKKSIQGWIRDRGITELRWMNKDGEEVLKRLETPKDFDQAAFVIMRGIKQNGIEPTHFVDNVLTEDYLNDFEETIANLWQ